MSVSKSAALPRKTFGSSLERKALLFVALSMWAGSSFAAGGGGLSAITGIMENLRSVIYTIVSVLSTIAFIWVCAQGFMGRKSWAEVFELCLWIFGAGGGIALATWIFSQGGSISL